MMESFFFKAVFVLVIFAITLAVARREATEMSNSAALRHLGYARSRRRTQQLLARPVEAQLAQELHW